MNAMQEKTDANLERMEAKTGSEIKTIHEKDGFKPRNGGSLLPRNKRNNGRTRGDESPGGFPRLQNRCQPKGDEDHVGCLNRKDEGKSRRKRARRGAAGSP
jgi:hypothetical protein